MPRVSVIIPTWNGAPLLRAALRSLEMQSFRDLEVVVVDNGSSDGTLAMLRDEFGDVRPVALTRNEGFAAAVNAGIRAARGEIIVLMNNDVEATPEWLTSLVDALDRHPEVGACASKMLLHADPRIIDSAGDRLGLFATSLGHGVQDGAAFAQPCYVFSACAGAAAYRRAVLDQVGEFDARFFAYLEDVDLGARIQLAGWQCLYVPRAVVYHHGSATARRMPDLKTVLIMRNSLFLFFQYMPARTILTWGAPMLGWPLYRALRERRPLLGVKALAGFLRDLPAVRARRSEIARTRRMTTGAFLQRLSGRAFGGRSGRLPLTREAPAGLAAAE